MSTRILVTGAAGKLGSAVVRHLLTSQAVAPARLIAATRDPSRLTDLEAQGVATRRADFDDPSSLAASFAGADTVLIVSSDSMEPGKREAQHLAAVKAATEAGVGRIAYTSLPDPEASVITFAPDHARTEAAIIASGRAYTIFRNNWYQENLFMTLPQALKTGQWFTSAGAGKVPYGARDDFAAAIAAGLARPAAGNAVHTLTGPEALAASDVAALVTELLGKPIAVVQISDDALEAALQQHGMPADVAQTIVSMDANIRAGHLDGVRGDVVALSGKPSRTLREFLEANRQALLG